METTLKLISGDTAYTTLSPEEVRQYFPHGSKGGVINGYLKTSGAISNYIYIPTDSIAYVIYQ